MEEQGVPRGAGHMQPGIVGEIKLIRIRGDSEFFSSQKVVEIEHGMNEGFACKDSLYMERVILKPRLYCFA